MRFVALFFVFMLSLVSAKAGVQVSVNKSTQTMSVAVDGVQTYTWRVSTGKAGFGTPTGTYGVKRMHRTYYSKKYYNSPMPHSLFFRGGYAIHGTSAIKQLGGPASHGCVRLSKANAAKLFALVSENPRSTRISIYGGGKTYQAKRVKKKAYAGYKRSYTAY